MGDITAVSQWLGLSRVHFEKLRGEKQKAGGLNPPDICRCLELDRVVELGLSFRGRRRRWSFRQSRISRRPYADAVDELALERSLTRFEDNFDPGPVVGFVAFAISATASNFVGVTTRSLLS